MTNNKISMRVPFFIFVGLVAMVFFGSFVNRYVLQSNAAQSKISVEFSPQTGTLGDAPFRIVLKPEKNNGQSFWSRCYLDCTKWNN